MKCADDIALLRGVNVGGNNNLPMRELRRFFEESGCVNVETYIQSGNVFFQASTKIAAALPRAIASAIEIRVGVVAPVIIRSAEQMRAVVDSNLYNVATAAVGSMQ